MAERTAASRQLKRPDLGIVRSGGAEPAGDRVLAPLAEEDQRLAASPGDARDAKGESRWLQPFAGPGIAGAGPHAPDRIWLLSAPRSHPAAAVVRRLGDHLDVVRVALGQPSHGDLDESCLLQLSDGPGAAVTHRRAQPADQLAGHRRQRSTVRHPTLDALRYQLVLTQHVILEVPV